MKRLPLSIEALDKDTALSIRRRQIDSFIVLQRLHSAVEHRTRALFKEYGIDSITPSQANVLMVLFQRRRPMTAREIHRELGVSEVTISRLVNALAEHSWIEKKSHPEDKRASHLTPTGKARDHLASFIGVANTLLDETFSGIDGATLKVLNEAILKIHSNLEDHDG
ncbi:MAG: MarR family winged helix-turn-helix transcriptional regulator [Bradymonadia bacterium]